MYVCGISVSHTEKYAAVWQLFVAVYCVAQFESVVFFPAIIAN